MLHAFHACSTDIYITLTLVSCRSTASAEDHCMRGVVLNLFLLSLCVAGFGCFLVLRLLEYLPNEGRLASGSLAR